MRTVSWMVGLSMCAISGCLVQSHELLSVEADAGASDASSDPTDAGPAEPYWARCLPLVEDGLGQHMDACYFSGSCFYAGSGPGRAATCNGGRVLLSTDEPLEHPALGSDCTGSLEPLGGGTLEIVSVENGCVEAERCRWVHEQAWLYRSRSCQLPPLPGVRDDAVGTAPWNDCDAALQGGMDGDPCTGSFGCVGNRGNDLLVVCDAGVLRMFMATRILMGVD